MNFKEKNLNEITLLVPNVFVAYDMIMSFYGQITNSGNLPNWLHQLEMIKCCDFFCLPFELDAIFGLNVPVEGYELLLDVIDIIGYNNETIKLLIKNMPMEYDLKLLPKELLEEMLKMETTQKIVSGSSDNSIKIWDANTGNLINTLNGHTNWVNSVCFSPDNLVSN